MQNKQPRTPYDGFPYYCKLCGDPYSEYMSCEEQDCQLESDEAAKLRQRKGVAPGLYKRAADLTQGDMVLMYDNSVRVVTAVDHGQGLIPKGREGDERCVTVYWHEGGYSTVLRDNEVLLAAE